MKKNIFVIIILSVIVFCLIQELKTHGHHHHHHGKKKNKQEKNIISDLKSKINKGNK